jgi:hypothetical protein
MTRIGQIMLPTMFVKIKKYTNQGHHNLWYFKCPDCGAIFISSIDRIARKKPCGNRAVTFIDKLIYCLDAIKQQGVSAEKIAHSIGISAASISTLYRNRKQLQKSTKNVFWANRLGLIGVNINFLYGYSCKPFNISLNTICKYIINN